MLTGAVLFGFTFMGVTTLTISWTRQRMPADSGAFIGVLTAVYGTGQVAGPIAAGWNGVGQRALPRGINRRSLDRVRWGARYDHSYETEGRLHQDGPNIGSQTVT
ncbi:YbfB/YjiJ family MFS transporter [Paenibacillus elgii]|uniref:YbfB/YjiJ family MFS transporter n=1 Tax=Paenibacillus elgii TaxID=189691 RepID=UPI002041BCE9|nr:YbfB/YjiJ family MFS transporter [Paenibacillus elgii]